MIVVCPNCETRFEIPEGAYRPGRKARCSSCGHVFVLPEADAADSAAAADDGVFPAGTDAGTGAEDPFDKDEDTVPPVSPASVDDIVPPPSRSGRSASSPKTPAGRNNFLLVLGVALVVALLGYGGIMVYSALRSAPDTTAPARISDGGAVESSGGRAGQESQEKESARQAAVRRLALENVRQYTVSDNENTGPMVVVEGSVVNNFDTPKDLVLLEVTLFDKKGNALVLREQYCGVTLTPMQLRTFSKAAIESALANQSSIIINNTDILPGGSVPFATVFFDLPRAAYEFEVKIVDVQDPAPRN